MEHLEIKKKLLGDSTRKPDITFYQNGRIDITSAVADVLELQPGDVIDIAEGKSDCHLYVRHRKVEGTIARHEGQCYPSKPGSRNFRAYSKKLCDAVLTISGGDTARIMAGTCIESDNLGKSIILILQHNLDNPTKQSEHEGEE